MDSLERSMITPAGEWVEKDLGISNSTPTAPVSSAPTSPYLRSTLPSAITGPDSARQFYGTGRIIQRFMQPMATNNAATIAPSNSQAKTEALRLVSSLTMDNISNGQTYSKVASNQVNDNGTIIDLTRFQGQWSASVLYQSGNEVEYQNYIWTAAQENINSAPSRTNTNWQLIGPTSLQNFQGSYNSANSYNPGDEVAFNGFVWQALIAVPAGQAPPTNATSNTYWNQIAPASHQDFTGNWNSTTYYYSGQIVDYNGNDYKALQNNSGQEPDTKPSYWSLIGPDTLDHLADGSTYQKPIGIVSGQTTTASYKPNSISGNYTAFIPTVVVPVNATNKIIDINIPAVTGTVTYMISFMGSWSGTTQYYTFYIEIDGVQVANYVFPLNSAGSTATTTIPLTFYSTNDGLAHDVQIWCFNQGAATATGTVYLTVGILKA